MASFTLRCVSALRECPPQPYSRSLKLIWGVAAFDTSVLPEARAADFPVRGTGTPLCPTWFPRGTVPYPLSGVRAPLHIQNLEPPEGFWRRSIPVTEKICVLSQATEAAFQRVNVKNVPATPTPPWCKANPEDDGCGGSSGGAGAAAPTFLRVQLC